MLKTTSFLITTFIPFAMPATAMAQSLRHDLDRDGRAETFELIKSNSAQSVSLRIYRPEQATITAFSVTYSDSDDTPKLEISRMGSLLIKTNYYGAGSVKDDTITIAYRQNDNRVIGRTFSMESSRDVSDTFWCDITLSTGRANRRRIGNAVSTFQIPPAIIPVSSWSADRPLPRRCFN